MSASCSSLGIGSGSGGKLPLSSVQALTKQELNNSAFDVSSKIKFPAVFLKGPIPVLWTEFFSRVYKNSPSHLP